MIGQRIRTLRLDNNESQAEFAKAFDLDQASVSLIENGNRLPGATLIKAIVKRYGTTYKWLLDGEAADESTSPKKDISESPGLSILIRNTRQLMREEKLTEHKFAIRCGLTQKWVFDLLEGQLVPTSEDLYRILQAFPDYSANWFLLDKGGLKNKMGKQAVEEMVRTNKELIALVQENFGKKGKLNAK